MGQAQAYNTVRGYRHSWKVFNRWCESVGKNPLPASPDTVALFITWAVFKREPKSYRIANVRHILSAIKDRHRRAGLADVTLDDTVKETIASAARRVTEDPNGKAALTPEQLLAGVQSLGDEPIEVRDHAVLVVGFASGWRCSELAALRLKDARLERDYLLLRLGRSKGDQEGKGREVRIPPGQRESTCPVRALKAWLDVRGAKPGPLFLPFEPDGSMAYRNMHPRAVNYIVKQALTRIGQSPKAFGAHSLRAGMATAAAEAGADIVAIMQRGGWKRIDTVLRYVRPAQGMRADPLKGVL